MYQEVRNKTKEEGTINFKKFFDKKSIIIYLISIFIGSAKLASGATPFGLALLGAIADTKFPLIIPWLLIGISTGVTFGGVCFSKFLISSLIFIILKSFLKENSKTGNSAKILFATAISEIIILLSSNTLIYDAVMAAFMSTTTAIFYLIFSEGLPVILEFNERKIDSHETLMAGGILLSVLISTIGDFNIWGLSVRGIVSVLIVLLLGWRRGAVVGVVSGVSISLVLGIMGIADASTVATYAVCGLLSGVLSRFGKVGAIIGFILGNAIWVFYLNASTEVVIPIGEIIVASVALLFMPKRISNFIDNMFDYDNSIEEKKLAGLLPENTIFKLNAVSEVAEDMATNVEKEELEQENKMTQIVKCLDEKTCSKCEHYEKCWKSNYHKTYEMIFSAVESLEGKGILYEKDIQDFECLNKAELAKGLNFSYELFKLNQECNSKINENKKLVAKQLRGVSKAINNVTESGLETTERLLGAGYQFEVGIASTKKKSSTVSGDNVKSVKLANGNILIGISDGMGSGEMAARSSQKVLELFEKYMNTGLEKETTLDLINSYMMLGENKENYATLDLVAFDVSNANAEFIKFGACPTYIKQDGSTTLISSKTLPVGATFNMDVEIFERTLNRGDCFVLISDGILESNEKKEKWIKELLDSLKEIKPQRTADIILQEAIDANFGAINDDMTVIVAKVC